MTTAATDPNGWVSNPPSVLVKVVNTTRDNLNGQMGVVLGYDANRTRYVIHLTVSQQQVSLKSENLILASWMEKMRGQWELFQNNADIQRNVQQFTNRIQVATGGRLNIQKVAILLFVLFVATVSMLGFSKTLLLLSFLVMMGIIIAPDLQQAGNITPRQVLQNLPMRIRTMIRQQVPYYGNVIADNNLYTAALVGLVLAFFVNAMVQGKGGAARTVAAATTTESSWFSPSRLLEKVGFASGGNGGGDVSSSSAAAAEDGPTATVVLDPVSSSIAKPYISKTDLLEDAYKRGFEDATNDKEFGTSLEELLQRHEDKMHDAAPATMASTYHHHHDEFHNLPPPRISSPPPRTASSSMMTASSMFSILYIGRTLYSAGQTTDGHGGFDVQLMIANLRTMDKIRLLMLGFSIYRLVMPFL